MVPHGTVDHTVQKWQRSNIDVLDQNIDVLDQLVSGTGHHVTEEETNTNSLAIGSMRSAVLERDDVLGEPRGSERQQPVTGDLDDSLVQE